VHKLTKVILVAIGVWLMTLVVLFIFPLPFLSWFAIPLSVPIAVVLLILSLVALVKDKQRRWPALSIPLVALVLYVALTQLMHWGALANFYLHRGYYEATAHACLTVQDDSEGIQICRDDARLMSRDPSRVAFHYVDGFLNWHDIVYDPSGSLITPKTVDEKFRINTYFRSAEHLTGDWYLCHFAD